MKGTTDIQPCQQPKLYFYRSHRQAVKLGVIEKGDKGDCTTCTGGPSRGWSKTTVTRSFADIEQVNALGVAERVINEAPEARRYGCIPQPQRWCSSL